VAEIAQYKMPSEKLMRSITRQSISEDFVVDTNFPVPTIPKGGARVKVSLQTLYLLETAPIARKSV
jgi:hypothetical protein